MITLGDVEYRRDCDGRWGLVVEDNPKSDWAVSPVLAAALDEIERLRAIVDPLPKSADGKHITIGMPLYDGCGHRFVNPSIVTGFETSGGVLRCLYFEGGFDRVCTTYYADRDEAKKARNQC